MANNLKRKTIKLCNFTWKKLKSNPLRTTSKFNFRLVNKIWVENQLRWLKRSKATVPDNVPPEMLKDCSNELSGPLCYLINVTVINGTIPNEWRLAKVIPIFKYGDRTDPNNCCPISILPILLKILERAVQSQLLDHLEKYHLLTNCQYGYRKNRSTEPASALLLDDIRKNADCGELVGAVFKDLSKAFNTIGHEILLSKLPSYGIRNTEQTWFTDYLFSRKQLVNFDKCSSKKESVLCGVPQGSIRGPLLFMICFNDFHTCLRHAKTIKFADDTVLYFSHTDFHVVENSLNDDIEHFFEFLTENELILNAKTEVMLFGTSKRLSKLTVNLSIWYGGETHNQTNRYKYLGALLDPSLSLNDNFNIIDKKASSRLRLLEVLKENLSDKACKCMYQSMVVPLLTYNCIANLNLNRTQLGRLCSLDRRVSQIFGEPTTPIFNLIKKHAVLRVEKCLSVGACSSFRNYFQKLEHKVSTRNNGKLLKIPKVKLEFARSGFLFRKNIQIFTHGSSCITCR